MHKKRIFKFFRISISAALAFSMIFGQIGSSLGFSYAQEVQAQEAESEYVEENVDASNASNAEKYGLADNTKDGVILHAFCWSFNTIKENMKDIAEAGYTTVQTSPANACNDSYPTKALWDLNQVWNTSYDGKQGAWWWHYQPTDWTIGNYQLGSAEDYKAMCEEADKYGVKIITDVIPNHTASDTSKVSQNLINAAGGSLYHANGFNQINNEGEWSWGNRLACTTGMMGGLPDVNTENQGFQAYYLKYCNDLIALGCDGFRYDTAKHIGVPSDPKDSANTRGVNDFWDVATGKKAVNGVSLSNKDNLFIYGEVLQGDNVPTSEYAGYMEQTASNYGGALREAVKNKNFSVGNISNWQHSDPGKIVTWVESHDTYMNNHESASLTNDQIKMAWALITARKDGTPLFLSRPDGSDGASGNFYGNNVLGAKGNDHFKDPEIVAVNKFRTAMIGQGEYLRNPNGSSQILQIDRGELGTCIINLGGNTSINSETTMADGTYTDQVSGREFTVSNGKISGQLDSYKVAVIYNQDGNTKPSIKASVEAGSTFTTDTIDVTFTVKNVASATYTIDNGESVPFTDSVTLTLGSDTAYGDEVRVRIDVTAEDGAMTGPVFSYKKKEAGKLEKNTVYFTKPSGWSSASIYAYIPNGNEATKLTGAWPGTAMTDEGNGVYSYTFDASVSECKVIFNDGKGENAQQTPKDEEGKACGYDYTSGKAYTCENEVWTAVEVSNPTTPPTNTPTNTPVPTVTEAPVGIKINSSLADNSSFSTETETIKITLENAEKGTYCVDDGPVKEFTNSADVVIGKGKIADSTVTVKVTAEGNGETATKTFTYTKEYVATYSNQVVPVNAGAAMEEVVEEAEVNAAAESTAYYATNPSGKVGKKATITIDGDCSDWTEDMKVANSGAWDISNNFKGAHENSVADCYGLYAAWDDENLYLGLEMVNTTDTWGNPGDGPLSDGGKISKVPIGFAIDTGRGNALTGKMEEGLDPYIWSCAIEFETRIDYLIYASAVFEGTPGLFRANAEGLTNYTTNCLSFEDEGISYKKADDSVSAQIMEVCNATSPKDVYNTAKYRDALTAASNGGKRNHDRKYDSFYEINIPLSSLGIDSTYIEQNGIGVMGLGTRGSSGIDCVPHDPTMLDNATGECAVDPSTSHEKDDTDVITVPLASVGKLRDGTVNPVTPAVTAPPVATSTPVPTAEPTDVPVDGIAVNFGADRSAPQYNSTALEIKAEVSGGTAPYNYEFFVDNVSVKNGAEDTYTWQNGSAGAHTIKVVVTDSTGKTATVAKEYDLEQ
ncbi:MAG: starch-binding protein, partial [Lachnospiraceae bacterium]|nr:starch-binding protein [Lachnospiraceae bacterium]